MHLDKNTGFLENRLMNIWIAILIIISLLLNPFAPSISNIEGELNPLLQTNLMVIHPPIVFLFYSLCLATSSIKIHHRYTDDGGLRGFFYVHLAR